MKKLENKLNDFLVTIEQASLNMEAIKTLPDYERGKAEGHFDGMTSIAAQVRALMEDEQAKPLTRGCRVLITNGPWSDHYGTYQGLTQAPTGKIMAEVIVDETDLPFLIPQEDLKAI